MRTSVAVIGGKPIYVDFEASPTLNGFYSAASAAAVEQGLLTREQAMRAEWRPAVQPAVPRAVWR